MQKWQEKQRQRFHQSIIENAKPTIKRTQNLTKSREKPFLQTSRSKQLRTPQSQNSFLPFVKILELFQLQKYSSLLIEHGFPHKLADKKSMKFIDDILDHVEEYDQERFLSLMNTLTIMSKDLKGANPQSKIPQPSNLKKQKSSKITHYPPQPPSTSNMRKSNNNLNSSKKAQKNTLFKVRQTNNFKSPSSQSCQPYLTSKFSLSKPSKSIQKLKEAARQSQVDRSTIRKFEGSNHSRKNSKTPKKHMKNAYDDTYITHNFKNSNKAVPTKIVENNKIIERLTEKLKKLNPQKYLIQKDSADFSLELDKIKKMYLSFDSATMTSNINNIDLEEMIECFVEEIYSRIDQTQRKKPNPSKMYNRSYLIKSKPTPVKKYIELENKEEIQYLLKQSMVADQEEHAEVFRKEKQQSVNPELSFDKKLIKDLKDEKQFLNRQQGMKGMEKKRIDTLEFEEEFEEDIEESIEDKRLPKDSLESPQEKHAVKEKLLKRQSSDVKSISINSDSSNSDSQDFAVDYEIESFVEDFSCFDSNLGHSLRPLQKQDIKNFVQLVVMAGKMEKQMPILAYMYLKKLLNTKRPYLSNPKLTLYNWKNIVLITLIESSKIWDDTSLENHSFSKVLKPYTTYEINRLEKYFLFYIDYMLTIDQKEYCEAYFELRRHSKDVSKTAHLMSLDIKTIQVLQNIKPGIKKKEMQLKEYYRKKMDKSF